MAEPSFRAARQTESIQPPRRTLLRLRRHEPAEVTFSPLAWLKLLMFLHAGETEVGGFGVSAEKRPLYIEDFVTVRQTTSLVTVAFDDTAVADYFDDCIDRGLMPARFARIWIHTHPGQSAQPSTVDEETFERVFGNCDWAMMFIVRRTAGDRCNLPPTNGDFMLLPRQIIALRKIVSKAASRLGFSTVRIERHEHGPCAMATDGRRAVIFQWDEPEANEFPAVEGLSPRPVRRQHSARRPG